MSLGFSQALVFKESASYGSIEDLTAGIRHQLLVKPDISIAKTIDQITAEHLRPKIGPYEKDTVLGAEKIGGSFSGLLPIYYRSATYEGTFGFILKHLLGGVTTIGPSGTKYTHSHYWNDKLFPGLSFGVNRNDKSYRYHGCQIKSLKLSGVVGQAVEFSIDIVGKEEVLAAAITPPTVGTQTTPAYWIMKLGTFKVATVSTPITAFDITFENQLEESFDRAGAIGSNQLAALAKTGHSVTGTLKRRLANDGTAYSKFYERALAETVTAIELSFVHPNPAESDYSLKVILNDVKFTPATPKGTDRSFIMEEIGFTAYDLYDTGSSFITVTDKVTEPATAQGAYDGS
jgi:hypothetical protein